MAEKAYDLGVLILKDGSWGAYNKAGKKATAAEVQKFLTTALAIAGAESGYDSAKVNGPNRGLFQIDSVKHAAIVDGRNLLDPLVNISVAAAISKQAVANGEDMFSPWSETMRSPFFQLERQRTASVYGQLDKLNQSTLDSEAARALMEFQKDSQPSALDRVLNPLGTLNDATGKVLQFVKESATVVGVFLLGIVLLIIGLILLVGRTVSPAAIVAKSVVKSA